ncbi:MAG: HD family hydrolase, partial [Bradymonadaceae bacterium]
MTDTDDRADELLRFLTRAGRLEALPRTGWLVAGVDRPESVAAHTYEVALVALWLADRVEADVDAERVLRIALLHDVGEALLTDLPKPVKEFVGADDVEEAEAEACREILEPLGLDWEAAPESYRDQDSPEARIIKAADRLQMLAKSLT